MVFYNQGLKLIVLSSYKWLNSAAFFLTANTTDVIILYVFGIAFAVSFPRYVASITGVLLYHIKCPVFVFPVDIMYGTKPKLHLVSFQIKHPVLFLLFFHFIPTVTTYTMYNICIITVTATFFTFKHSLLPFLSLISHYPYYATKKKHHI